MWNLRKNGIEKFDGLREGTKSVLNEISVFFNNK